MSALKAWCFRSGELAVGKRVPAGALLVAASNHEKFPDIVSVVARHGYDGKTLLVPGLPEADSEDEAIAAVRRCRGEIAKRLTRLSDAPLVMVS